MSAWAHATAQVRSMLAQRAEVFALQHHLDEARQALARATADLDRAVARAVTLEGRLGAEAARAAELARRCDELLDLNTRLVNAAVNGEEP